MRKVTNKEINDYSEIYQIFFIEKSEIYLHIYGKSKIVFSFFDIEEDELYYCDGVEGSTEETFFFRYDNEIYKVKYKELKCPEKTINKLINMGHTFYDAFNIAIL